MQLYRYIRTTAILASGAPLPFITIVQYIPYHLKLHTNPARHSTMRWKMPSSTYGGTALQALYSDDAELL